MSDLATKVFSVSNTPVTFPVSLSISSDPPSQSFSLILPVSLSRLILPDARTSVKVIFPVSDSPLRTVHSTEVRVVLPVLFSRVILLLTLVFASLILPVSDSSDIDSAVISFKEMSPVSVSIMIELYTDFEI